MIITLGEILIDRIAEGFGHNLPHIQSWTDFPGGAPANVACSVKRLGTASAFCGAIGNDEIGDRLLATLTDYAVNLDLVQRCDAPTRQVYVTRNAQGDRRFAGFGHLSSSAFADTKLRYRSYPLFSKTSFFYLGTLILAQAASRQAVDQYLAYACSNEIPIFMDVNWRPMFWDDVGLAKQIILERLSQINFIKLSDDEALWLLGSQSPELIRDRFPHLRGIFITGGDKGCRYLINEFVGKVPGFAVDTIDTTGAGDGFVAGCLHQLANNATVQTASEAEQFVRYANAVGALTTLQLGAIAPHPTAEDVEQFLSDHPVTKR